MFELRHSVSVWGSGRVQSAFACWSELRRSIFVLCSFVESIFTVQDLACNSDLPRSEEHTSELQSLMRISYAVFCLKKKNTQKRQNAIHSHQYKILLKP